MKCFVVCLLFASLINGYQRLASPDVFHELPSKPRCDLPKFFSDKIEKLQGSEELSDEYKSVKFSLHHIIAYNDLRRFYNKVLERSRIAVKNNEESILNEVRIFFRTINETVYFNPTYKPLNYKYSEVQPFFNFILTSPLKSINDDQKLPIKKAQRKISCAFMWLPSDLFVGPSPRYRKDDPGADFEDNAVVVVGKNQHGYLRQLQTIMELYVDWNSRTDSESIMVAYMKMMEKRLDKIKNSRPSFDFKKEDWKFDGTKFELKSSALTKSSTGGIVNLNWVKLRRLVLKEAELLQNVTKKSLMVLGKAKRRLEDQSYKEIEFNNLRSR